MAFSEEQLEELRIGYAEIAGKYQALLIRYTHRQYSNAKAAEYAVHGIARRLKILVRCIDRVYELLPPDLADIPTSDHVSDAVINIQAFTFNIFGCMDNLAWIWVIEKDIRENNGKPLHHSRIGLRNTNKVVRQSFSPEFQTYLQGLDPWFDRLENFRHALAHRIPLYIPPYIVSPESEEQHHRLDQLIIEANIRYDPEESERLLAEQMRLVRFAPIMTHSFGERAKYVIFHAQLLADFNTVDELGLKFLDELDGNCILD